MTYTYEQLKQCAMEILTACGESPQNAEIGAEAMVAADMRGITTHGTYLLIPIFKRVKAGQLNLPTKLKVIMDDVAVAKIDGGDGLGAVAGRRAADIAIKKAKNLGIGLVLIRNTNNIGTLAWYTEYIAKQGMIAVMSCNAAPAMAPWGGAEQFLGTNPIAVAIYTGTDVVFSADMATSIVARGKIRKAARNGESIPSDWAVDEEGNFTTDPGSALKGALLPMGGPKGSALAFAVDIVSGMLSGAKYAPHIKSFHKPEGQTGVGASIIALDIEHFMSIKDFGEKMQEYITKVKSLKKAKGFNSIYLPGEIEYGKELDSKNNGISLDENTVMAINNILSDIKSSIRLSQ
ncbi:MAG: Ldh family oxidoreductase [Acetivibrionales bacterium]|jgi:LDH2 family malate/lactate/ureidoglycolate dehydrogenase